MALPASIPDLALVFDAARKRVQRDQTIEADHQRVWDEIRISFERSQLPSGYFDAFMVIRDAFNKDATASDMHAVDSLSYGGETAGQQLFEMRWHSNRCGREMYLKFALFDGRFVLMKLHESVRPTSSKIVGIQTRRSQR